MAVVDTDQTDPQQDDATSTVFQNPSLTIMKGLTNANDAVVDTAGEVIEYTITVENDGNVDLTNVMLTDPFAGGATFVSGDDGDGILETDETWTYTADYTVTQADLNAGADLVNVAVVDTDQTDPQQDDATIQLAPTSGILLKKDVSFTDNGAVGLDVGDVLNYTFDVTNTGNVTLNGVIVEELSFDLQATNGTMTIVAPDDTTLSPGETQQWTATVTLNQADINAIFVDNDVDNVATASGTPPSGPNVTDQDDASLSLTPVLRDPVVIANDKGPDSKPLVTIIDGNQPWKRGQFLAYEESYTGGVRVATGDLDGDGIDEIVTAPGLGHEVIIKVWRRTDSSDVDSWQLETSFSAYDASFDGGAMIAIGNLVNDDGLLDIVVTPSFRAEVTKIFENVSPGVDDIQFNATPDKEFYAFAPGFIGGSVVSTANIEDTDMMDGVDLDEVILGSGGGMRATVKAWEINPALTAIRTYEPFSDTFVGGVSLDMGDINGDGIPDVIVGAGYLGGSKVEAWNGIDDTDRMLAFAAYGGEPSNYAPLRIVGKDTDGDGKVDRILTAQGPQGGTNEIQAYDLMFTGNADEFDAIFNPVASFDIDDLIPEDLELFGAYFFDLLDPTSAFDDVE